ncbi:MAG TPA: TIM barrel protein [Tepidisphaeraceae bacterium]|jgi:sugar phosphate isomerase/epimerase
MVPTFSVPAHCIHADLREAIPTARSLGFAGVEFDVGATTLDLSALSTSGRRELRHLVQSHGAQLTALRGDAGPAGLGPSADVDRVLDRADQLLSLAAGLGCALVCLDLGRLPPAQRTPKPKPAVTADMAGLLILPAPAAPPADTPPPEMPTKIDPALLGHWQQALGQLGEIADRYGVVVAMSSSLSSMAALLSIVRTTACPWFGVDLDTAAARRDEWPVEAVFDEVGNGFRHVRLRDLVLGDASRSKPAVIGRGDVAWRTLFELLDGAGYHGPLAIDSADLPEPRAAAVAGLKQLQATLSA